MKGKFWAIVVVLALVLLIGIGIWTIQRDIKRYGVSQHVTVTRTHGALDADDKWLYVFGKQQNDDPNTPQDETQWILLNPNPAHPEITQPR